MLHKLLVSVARFFLGDAKPEPDPDWDWMAAKVHPRITVEEHLAAVERIQEAQKAYPWAVIDFNDLRPAQGYVFRITGYDTFGWPSGHPDSPLAYLRRQANGGQ